MMNTPCISEDVIHDTPRTISNDIIIISDIIITSRPSIQHEVYFEVINYKGSETFEFSTSASLHHGELQQIESLHNAIVYNC